MLRRQTRSIQLTACCCRHAIHVFITEFVTLPATSSFPYLPTASRVSFLPSFFSSTPISLFSLSLSIDRSMAAENEPAVELPLGGRGMTFFPFLVGFMGPAEAPDSLVLVNPVAQRMLVLQGDAAVISQLLSGGGDTHHGPPPASMASIKALKTVEVIRSREEAVEECPVCLEELHAVNIVKEMPCRHSFHGACVEKWLSMHGSCPVCRYQMPEENERLKKGGDGGEVAEERARRREVWVTLAFGRRGEETGQVEARQEDGGVEQR